MDSSQVALNNIIVDICEERCVDYKIEKGGDFILALCISGEIRDVEWKCSENGQTSNLYQGLFLRLHKIWQFTSPGKSITNSEAVFIRIWSSIVLLSEYDVSVAYNVPAVSSTFVDNAIKRIMTLSKFADAGSNVVTHGLTAASTIFILQQLVLRIYHHRADLRERIRHFVVKYVLCINQSTKDTERSSQDGGKTRAHVQYMLKILHAIIAGFQVTSSHEVYLQRRELLLDVFIPLHLPNEMIEWRDQIPVLQTYHEDLVKCVIALTQKSDDGYYLATDRASDSLLTEALLQILRHWPESFNTNTPKQVLLLHEIEILVERLDVKRLLPVHDALLDRLVKCVGTNADNIRPAQRALQFFKNGKVMDVIFPVSSDFVQDRKRRSEEKRKDEEKRGLYSPSERNGDVDEEEDDDDESERFRVATKTFGTLLPSLFRSGQPSWNPTVNKMTALALKRFLDMNESLVRSALEDHFGKHHSQGSRVSDAMRPSRSTTSLDFKTSTPDANRFVSPVGPGISSSTNTANGLPPKLGVKKPFDAVARMPAGSNSIANPGASSPLSFPPMIRPRTQMDAPVNVSTMPGRVNHSGSSLSSNASGRMNPPVTVTGVAPWAMQTKSASSISSSHSTLPLHTVPPSALAQAKDGPLIQFPSELNTQRVMMPLPPSSSGHQHSRHIASTVSESKQRDAAILAAASAKDANADDDDVSNSEGDKFSRGYEAIRSYMLRLYPQVFANDGDFASLEAQGKDWCWSQAAATPSLLPNLKFHDLVFGQILGEGAFSTVKYARHITKGKSQSEWPEYAVKMIDAKKVIEHQYSLSVIREISVLQLLLHPGISRMIQAFQYNGSAYLVLEYASRGDLHSYLLKAGRVLSHKHNLLRFIISEMAAAVHAIHEHGFVYNDLKPENILITELGHVKITDFGACRPYTTSAKRLVRESCQRLMDLPDGNWKVTSKDEENETTGAWRSIFQDPRLWEEEQDKQQEAEDKHNNIGAVTDKDERRALVERCEGTPGYMPPEAFAADGSISSAGSDVQLDAWSLGCVIYFCYHGKPRFFGDDPKSIMEQMQIWFEEQQRSLAPIAEHHHGGHHSSSHHQVHFTNDNKDLSGGDHDDQHSAVHRHQQIACETLIKQLLSLRGERLSIAGVLDHPYLTTGLLPEHHEILQNISSSNNDNSNNSDENGAPVVYDTRSLHALPPPRWPEVSEDGQNSHSGDPRWARRQFSTLWAPMPQVYNVNGDENFVAPAFLVLGTKGGTGKDEQDLLHSVLRVPLPVVEESHEELHSSFISRF